MSKARATAILQRKGIKQPTPQQVAHYILYGEIKA